MYHYVHIDQLRQNVDHQRTLSCLLSIGVHIFFFSFYSVPITFPWNVAAGMVVCCTMSLLRRSLPATYVHVVTGYTYCAPFLFSCCWRDECDLRKNHGCRCSAEIWWRSLRSAEWVKSSVRRSVRSVGMSLVMDACGSLLVCENVVSSVG